MKFSQEKCRVSTFAGGGGGGGGGGHLCSKQLSLAVENCGVVLVPFPDGITHDFQGAVAQVFCLLQFALDR